MLKTKLLDLTRCAGCTLPISLVQINGKTLAVERQAGYIGNSLIMLEVHKCDPRSKSEPPPEPPTRQPSRKVF